MPLDATCYLSAKFNDIVGILAVVHDIDVIQSSRFMNVDSAWMNHEAKCEKEKLDDYFGQPPDFIACIFPFSSLSKTASKTFWSESWCEIVNVDFNGQTKDAAGRVFSTGMVYGTIVRFMIIAVDAADGRLSTILGYHNSVLMI